MRVRFIPMMFVAVVLAASAMAGEQETRSAFGSVRAQALDALIARLYPGARVQWAPELAIILGDGSKRRLRVTDTIDREEAGGGHTFIMPLEYPDEQERVAKAIDALEPAGSAATEIVAFKTGSDLAITEVRRAAIPDSANLTTVVSIDRGSNFSSDPWPSIALTYNAYYGTVDWVGQIEWNSLFSTASMTITHRLPGFVAKALKDGATLVDQRAFVVPLDESFDIYSPDQKRFIMSCTIPCLPDGKVMLGLWGPTSTTVATVP